MRTLLKGVAHLFRAFERVAQMTVTGQSEHRPILVYIGAGPQFEELTLACS